MREYPSLGQCFRDPISGFEGLATGRTVYLHGEPPQIRLTPAGLREGKPADEVWFVESRLEPIQSRQLGFSPRPDGAA